MGRVPGSTFRWTKEATEALLHSLITSINAGLRADLGYSHRAWVYAVEAASTAQGGDITMRQAKTKHDGLKADYKIWIPLMRQLWFTRDADGDVVAPEAEWNAYIMAHPEAKKFKHSQIEFESLLEILFPEVRAKAEQVGPALLPTTNLSAEDGHPNFDLPHENVLMDMHNSLVDPRINVPNPHAQVRIPRPEAQLGIVNSSRSNGPGIDNEAENGHVLHVSSPTSSSEEFNSATSSTFSMRKRAPSHRMNPLVKRTKKKKSEGQLLAESIKGLASSMKVAAKTFEQGANAKIVAKAAALFFEDHKDWPYQDQFRVTEALENEAKARIYLVAPKEYRDGWAKRIVGRTD